MKNNSKNRKLLKIRLKNELKKEMMKFVGKEITKGVIEDVKIKSSEVVISMKVQPIKSVESVNVSLKRYNESKDGTK